MKEYEDEISKSSKQIDIQKLKDVIRNDLLKEKLITWLEENSTVKEISEKATKVAKTPKQTTAKSNAKKRSKTKSESKVNKKEKK